MFWSLTNIRRTPLAGGKIVNQILVLKFPQGSAGKYNGGTVCNIEL